MKKGFLISFLLFMIWSIPVVSAAPQCQKQDETKWEYQNTINSGSLMITTNPEEQYICCGEVNAYQCDYYKLKNGTSSNGGVGENGYNSVKYTEAQCHKPNGDTWKYLSTTQELSDRSFISERYMMICCKGTLNLNSYQCDYYELKGGLPSNDISGNNGGTGGENNGSGTKVNYCEGLTSTFIFIGHIVRLAKILIPIIIIGFGMLDFFKAVTAAKDDEIKKSAKSLIFRAISGVCIFFLPMFIDLIFSWVSGWSNNYEASYKECFKCIWDVGNCSK